MIEKRQGGQMNEAQKILSVDNDFSVKAPKNSIKHRKYNAF